MKKALITGITGQDGSYLAELLLHKGYEVHGLIRRTTNRKSNIDPFREKLHLYHGDMSDGIALSNIIDSIAPEEVYNLAAQSQVKLSFADPVYTSQIAAVGNVSILEILRKSHPRCRFYQASTSEMFGSTAPPQSETSPLFPQSPYAIAKVHAHHMVRIYREGYDMFACCGILFNHESPRRGEEFVTRKITKAVANIAAGKCDSLMLGNTESKRDWGYAKEYVEAMWLMLQQEKPDDFVIATGEAHSVQEFVETAFSKAGLDWKRHLKHNDQFLRPIEPNVLCGDPRKAAKKLPWVAKTKFAELVDIMLQHDLAEARAK